MALTGSYGVNSTKTWTTDSANGLPAKLKDIASDKRGKWMFVLASAAIAQYAAVGIDGSGNAAELTTTTYASSAAFGFAQVAIASGSYGWVWVGEGGGTGSGIKGKVAASYAAFAVINTTATAGVVDDAATKILGGVVGLTTDGGSGSSVELMAAAVIHKVTA